MKNDKLKIVFSQKKDQQFELPKGHEKRFLEKLNKDEPDENENSSGYKFIGWAAVLIPLILIGGYFLMNNINQEPKPQDINLGEYAEGLDKANDYFKFSIEQKLLEIEKIQTKEDKEMVNYTMAQLDTLEMKYDKLLIDLAESGGNPQVIKSVMTNLQLRMTVLEKLMEAIEHKNQMTDENKTL